MRYTTSPIHESRIARFLPRLIPRPPVAEGVVCLLIGVAVAWKHGTVWGGLAFGLQAMLFEAARRNPQQVVAFVLFAFALPKLGLFRFEDFAIAALCMAALRSGGKPTETRLDGPMAVYVAVLGLTAGTGLALGTIASPLMSGLTLLKNVELLCGFFAAAWVADEKRLENVLLLAVGLLSVGACLYLFLSPETRPFDAPPFRGESNHVGGLAALAAIWLIRRRPVGAALALLLLLATGSRTAMLGVAVGFLVLRSRIAAVFLGVGILAALVLPGVRDRLLSAGDEWTVHVSSGQRVADGYPPHYSWTRNRVEVWSLLIDEYRRFPFFGTGPGSRHRVLYESQYFMTLCESGLFGLAALLFLAWSVWTGFRDRRDIRALLAAMLVMSLTSIAFTLSRTAGPFWILAGAAALAQRNTSYTEDS